MFRAESEIGNAEDNRNVKTELFDIPGCCNLLLEALQPVVSKSTVGIQPRIHNPQLVNEDAMLLRI